MSSQLAQHQADLAGLLSEIPVADNALPKAVRSGYVQLYENIIVCGLPGGGRGRQPARLLLRPTAGTTGAASDHPAASSSTSIVFFAVSFALVGYGIVNLLGNPLESPTMLTTEFANASGLYSGFEVELNGVPVGTVSSTALTKTGTKVTMRIDPGTERARRRAVVGADRQRPGRAGGQPGADPGRHRRPRSRAAPPSRPRRTRLPADVGQVVASATRLLQAIPAGNLNKLIGELATALQGNAGNLRTLINAGTTFSKEFVAYQQQFTELLANAPPALDAVTAVAPELRQDLANTAALVQVLAEQKSGLHTS